MIVQPCFDCQPWRVREIELHLDVLSQTESVFALSNGHIGLRGNLDEGEPQGLPGSYLNGVYEQRPLPYAEAGFGYPESGQTVINVTNGKLFRLLVDDEPFDVRYGELLAHERVLDLRAGTLQRRVRWRSPAGHSIGLSSTRLVSFTQRSIAAFCYEVEAIETSVHVVIQSELLANESLPPVAGDPRVAAVLEAPLVSEDHRATDARVVMVHHTRASGLRVAAGMDHVVDATTAVEVLSDSFPDLGRVAVTTVLDPGQRLRIVKFLAYGWSAQRSLPALRDQVAAALLSARQTGWDGLQRDQQDYLDRFWGSADVEVEGDEELQAAVRFALFHVLQAGARGERRAIPAKGLTGSGYDGHCFWDTETFVLPVLTYTMPDAAADELRWRQSTLPLALERARQLGLAGAAFPWRTITGHECSAYWPAGTAAVHVNADIADATIRYLHVSGDDEFGRDTACELLVQTARLWCSLGHHEPGVGFRIDGVTGPDEYSALADNNVYTNLMAQRNLRGALDAIERWPERAAELGVTAVESEAWAEAAEKMVVPFDPALGVHPQADGFTDHELWDFAATAPEQYPLLLHFPYFDLYRKQVVKQADLVLALHLRGDAFTPEEKAADFAYYEALTVRDSSLSACTQAVVAAEVGHLELAHAYLREAALMDLGDLERNTRDGLHLASLAGAWIAIVSGFGGLRDHDGIAFSPKLIPGVRRLAFTVAIADRCLRVEITRGKATYSLKSGDPLEVLHYGARITVAAGQPVERRWKVPRPAGPPPSPPPGREPGVQRPAGATARPAGGAASRSTGRTTRHTRQ
jgi:alpha,alpha-trehalose phosphorylase